MVLAEQGRIPPPVSPWACPALLGMLQKQNIPIVHKCKVIWTNVTLILQIRKLRLREVKGLV